MDESVASDLLRARYWNEAVSIEAGASAHVLGSGGLFIATGTPPRLGSLLDFELSIGGPPPVRGIVEVVEVRDDATDAMPAGMPAGMPAEMPAGMRVKFVHLDDEDHAREVLGRMAVAQTASLRPPPAADASPDPDAPPASSRGGAVWDNAVALEEDFFDRASRVSIIVADDEAADALALRLDQPEFVARRQRLRRTFIGVIAVAGALFVAMVVRVRADGPQPPKAPVVPAAPAQLASASAPRAPATTAAAASSAPPATVASAEPAVAATPTASTTPAASASAPSTPEGAASAPSAIAPAAKRRAPGGRPRAATPASRPKAPAAPPAPPAPPTPPRPSDAIYE